MLTEWRAAWTFNKDSSGPAVAWSIVRTFFRWAHSIDLLPSDPSAKLRSLPVVRKQVQPLTRQDMSDLLAAASRCGFSPEIEERVRVCAVFHQILPSGEGSAILPKCIRRSNCVRG